MHPPPKSYFSPKVKIGPSLIQGQGLLAIEDIKKDELIGIKDGYIIGRDKSLEVGGWKSLVGQAMLQIEDNFFLGPTQDSEISLSMMHVNHSCNPTVGFLGNCISVAMRDVKIGEELAQDYATWLADPDYSLVCSCGAEHCRKNISGNDWQKTDLQEKYKGYFSSYIQKKINTK